MPTGRLLKWNAAKGYGFIAAVPENAFVHATTLAAGGVFEPHRGDIIDFEIGAGVDGRVRAVAARLVEPEPEAA